MGPEAGTQHYMVCLSGRYYPSGTEDRHSEITVKDNMLTSDNRYYYHEFKKLQKQNGILLGCHWSFRKS